MKWNEMKWNEMKWNEAQLNGMEWKEMKHNQMEWMMRRMWIKKETKYLNLWRFLKGFVKCFLERMSTALLFEKE